MADPVWALPLAGGCRCGTLRYEVRQAPLFVMACHCTDCQQQTASAFSLGMPVPQEGFVLRGTPVVVTKTADSGNESRAYRCPTCGVWTHTTTDASPGLVVVRPTTLDAHEWVRPVAQIFTASALPWAVLDVAHSYDREFEDPAPIAETFAANGVRPR